MPLLKHSTVLKKKGLSNIFESVFEERPTKLEIPNDTPLGGEMDGMDDMDNAPAPPMGSDIGMEDPMGGNDAAPMDDPNAMGDDPMAGDEPMGNEDGELMDIIDNLSIEDKAAVTKYAKSMVDDSNGEMPQDENPMPMESRRSFKSIIDETINDVLDNKEGTKRPEKRMPKQYRGINNPFKSPF